MKKQRLDILVTERGLAPSREKAKAFIMAGEVMVNGEISDKAGQLIAEDCEIEVKSSAKYVSRGGLKLEKAMGKYGLNLHGKVCMDIGASTGGFTDCMLQNGATKVYAVDVGYGQLAWKLRTDDRVINMERTNARYLEPGQVSGIDFCSVDVAFISLTIVLPVVYNLLNDNGEAVALIKPQFEAGKENVGKKGVVRDPAIHYEVIKKITDFCENQGFIILDVDFSPIKGPEGNIEYLCYIKKARGENLFGYDRIAEIVKQSHEDLQ